MNDFLDDLIDRARPSWLVYGMAICVAIIVVAVLGAL